MIDIIPSLAVLDGKCVRLKQGDYNQVVVYDDSVLDIAKKFEDHGIRKVHLIDLDGAKQGKIVNYFALDLLRGHTSLEIDFGGGVNTDGDLTNAFEYGASKVTVGSLAINNPEMFTSWVYTYGKDKITLSADSKEGIIQIRGWQKRTETTLFEHIDFHHQRSVEYIKCSDVTKDGTLEGPAFDLYSEVLKRFPDIKLLASGGISSMDDIKKLEDMGVYGAIIGKAYYQEKISLKEIEKFQSTHIS